MIVELRLAFAWDCPNCGREQFARGLVREMSGEEGQELRDEYGIQPYEEGEFLESPDTVTCAYCNNKFNTHWLENDEEDD